MPPAHEPFDRLVAALAARVYGAPGDRPRRLPRAAFRLAVAALALALAAVAIRHHALPRPWHRWAYAIAILALTVQMRGERWRGDPRLSVAAATTLALAIAFVAWLALVKG